jgi:NADPH:quinone reductase
MDHVSMAPLSFRGTTYSGMFALLPLLTGQGRAHQGQILGAAAGLAEAGQLRPLLNERSFNFNELEMRTGR